MFKSVDSLVAQVRAEYREMPGLRLTLAQACRLWNLEAEQCRQMLEQLRASGVLRLTPDNAFVAASSEARFRTLPAMPRPVSGVATQLRRPA